MKYTAVKDNLTISTAYAKNWLKVDDATDDELIADLVTISKEIADDFLQNDFRTMLAEEVGIGDDSTIIFNLDQKPIQDQSLKLYLLREGADIGLAKYKPWRYGILQEQDTNDAIADYALNLTTGAITFNSLGVPEQGEIIFADRYRLQSTAEITIPGTIKMGVLDMLGYLYEKRVGGKSAEAVSGLGNVTWMKVNGWEISADIAAKWAPYRKNPGT